MPLAASHRKTLPSSLQLANRVPSGLHATRVAAACVCPTHRRTPVFTSHTCTPRIVLAPASHFPSGLHATPKIKASTWSGSCKVCALASVAASQSRMVLSNPLLPSLFPSGLHPPPSTTFPCPH